MTQELSPQARKVFEAFNSKFDWVEDGVPGPQFNSIAAALRAAMQQAMPPYPYPENFSEFEQGVLQAHTRYRVRLSAIATELEAQ